VNLPQEVLETGDGNDTVGPVEVGIHNERDAVLKKLGFLPMVEIQNSSDAVVMSPASFLEAGE
jgi:predicted component of type VI protein secretion system